MAIEALQFKSVLLIALDPVDAKADNADGMQTGTSNTGGEETEKALLEKSSFLDRFLKSDSNLKLDRVPIIIDDKIIPAHHVGSSTNMNKFVDYDNTDVAIVPGSNGLSIQIQIKNSLSQISTAADIFSGVTEGQFDLFRTSPRVSFFSTNTCIFNAYLSGVTRQTQPGSDLEIINISLEKRDPKDDTEEDKDKGEDGADKEGEHKVNDGDRPEPEEGTQGFAIRDTTTPPVQPTNAGGRIFGWYETQSLDDIELSPVPQIFGKKTIENLNYELHVSRMYDFTGTLRTAINVLYNDIYIPLGLNDLFPYYLDGYAVDVVDGMVYLGVEIE